LRPFDTRYAGIGARDSLCRGEPGEGWLTRLEMGLGLRAGRPHDRRRGRRCYCREIKQLSFKMRVRVTTLSTMVRLPRPAGLSVLPRFLASGGCGRVRG